MASCYDKAVQLLARRAHFRRQLERKLSQRGYGGEEVEETLARLQRQGYLDDRAAARQLVEARLARGPEGRRRLAAELARRGAGEEVIAETLDELLPGDDLAAARAAAERWRRGHRFQPASLARHLERKGFSRRAILTLLEEAGGEDDTTHEIDP